MALTVGIIGLPQSGKTTLFNALPRPGRRLRLSPPWPRARVEGPPLAL